MQISWLTCAMTGQKDTLFLIIASLFNRTRNVITPIIDLKSVLHISNTINKHLIYFGKNVFSTLGLFVAPELITCAGSLG